MSLDIHVSVISASECPRFYCLSPKRKRENTETSKTRKLALIYVIRKKGLSHSRVPLTGAPSPAGRGGARFQKDSQCARDTVLEALDQARTKNGCSEACPLMAWEQPDQGHHSVTLSGGKSEAVDTGGAGSYLTERKRNFKPRVAQNLQPVLLETMRCPENHGNGFSDLNIEDSWCKVLDSNLGSCSETPQEDVQRQTKDHGRRVQSPGPASQIVKASFQVFLEEKQLTTLPEEVRGQSSGSLLFVPERCKTLKEMDLIRTSESDCYCYNQNSQMDWRYTWSTMQVKITSPGLLSIVYITERHNCQYPETMLSYIKCVIHNFWTPKESNEITIVINPHGDTMCFSVEPIGKILTYTISVKRNLMDFKLFLVFVAGVFLFFYAETLSQSPIFYYSSGTMLGVLMTLVFVLLLVKRHIPKYSTFGALMIGCWFASVYVVCQLMEDLKCLWCENRIYVLGYVLIVGFFSFAVCYKHGPLEDDRSRRLLTWTLRLLSLVLVYAGVAVPQLALAAVILLPSSRSLRYVLKALSYLRWDKRKMKPWLTSEKLVVKHLSEDEYREQADAETSRALEGLRCACRRPDFPSWLAVSRLQTPGKFADFVLGGSHLSPEEIRLHEEQYGLGGTFLEEQLFNPRAAGHSSAG
ncbi:nuclear envelope integral membrane protein 2 [Carlito syrichta]|uniref:Nuclear envelope integral membrane protein 2 n=1 Tax=Carlito syrichta TaxID=1868482 RepID=A0A3Q0DL83_CARSF|nr:nuclear envelope integral membrane protein 2 [Carlito syrichta]